MESVLEDIVIVGGGVAGLATSLGLHRLGIRSLVLESSDNLRSAGYALTAFTNAWKALDALGIGDLIRQQHELLQGNVTTSTISGLQTSELPYKAKGKHGEHEVRCVKRRLLLEALAKELPSGTIRFSSEVVCIEESGFFKLVHQWSSKARGSVEFKHGHRLEPKFMQFFGEGVRSGAIPIDDNSVYWFVTWTPSSKEEELEQDPAKVKQLILSKLGKIPEKKGKGNDFVYLKVQ
ncbi:monooxygenase 3-like [Fagus crenata]